VPRRNPETATILSVFLPGVGQLYNGEGQKGLVYLGIAFILFLGTGLLKGVGVLLWLSFWAYNVFDAYSTARGRT
jgi:TM2 domain-containing membrane protein YozV